MSRTKCNVSKLSTLNWCALCIKLNLHSTSIKYEQIDTVKNLLCELHMKPHNTHCKFWNARFEFNSIVIFIYRHYPLDQNAKAFDTKGKTFDIIFFYIQVQVVMLVYKNYDVIAFRNSQCIL